MTEDELQAIEARANASKWPALPETLRDTAGVLSRFVRKKGDQNVIDQLQAAADEVEALRGDSSALVAEVRRLRGPHSSGNLPADLSGDHVAVAECTPANSEQLGIRVEAKTDMMK